MTPTLPRRLDPSQQERLHDVATTRVIEAGALARHPPGTLMDRAGHSVARLLRAWQPQARHIDVVCGPGHNGGDGLVAAAALQRHLQSLGQGRVRAWLLQAPGRSLPADAADALQQAQAAGVDLRPLPEAPDGSAPWGQDADLLIDALLGIGARALEPGPLASAAWSLAADPRPVLCIDLPSGLDADTGRWDGPARTRRAARVTLSMLTLKPGLLTGHGRDLAGEVWLDDLGVAIPDDAPVAARWGGFDMPHDDKSDHPHTAHKGSYGDVAVLPGQSLAGTGLGMAGAAVLAARAALHGGAGRVYLGVPATPAAPEWDPMQPELMLRHAPALLDPELLASLTVVAGCGGGATVSDGLATVLAHAARLVLDADGLNAVARDPALREALQRRGWMRTVITPHPLEAARLLGCSTADVMSDRLGAASGLAQRLQVVCVLKGAGTVVATPQDRPWINASGNARLATAGTGDVLAGMVAAAIARQPEAVTRQVCRAVHAHGAIADAWDPSQGTLTAAALARSVSPV